MNDCPRCDHQSSSDLEAYLHWRGHYQGPVVEKGMLVTVIGLDGQAFTERVTDVVVDRKTGDQRIMTGEDPLARATKSIRKMHDAMQVLLRPRWIPLRAWKVWLKHRR